MKVIMNLLLLIVFLFAFDTSSFADSVTLTSTVSTSKSASRFTDNGDNTITDNVTGLTWINNVSQVGTAWYETPMKWVDAIKNCEELSYAGYPDWRLPNIKELQSILNFERSDHSIGEGTSVSPWVNTKSSYYWSSTTDAADTTQAWAVYFGPVHWRPNPKTLTFWVRPVRGG